MGEGVSHQAQESVSYGSVDAKDGCGGSRGSFCAVLWFGRDPVLQRFKQVEARGIVARSARGSDREGRLMGVLVTGGAGYIGGPHDARIARCE